MNGSATLPSWLKEKKRMLLSIVVAMPGLSIGFQTEDEKVLLRVSAGLVRKMKVVELAVNISEEGRPVWHQEVFSLSNREISRMFGLNRKTPYHSPNFYRNDLEDVLEISIFAKKKKGRVAGLLLGQQVLSATRFLLGRSRKIKENVADVPLLLS